MEDDSRRRILNELAIWLLPGGGVPTVERVPSGMSTPVYRIRRDRTTLYVRLAERSDASLAPEVFVHQDLRSRGVRVPEVIHFDPFNQELGRSLMVTTEIPGEPIGWKDRGLDLSAVLVAAGRDVASINSIPVTGFGWIRRDRPRATALEATMATLRLFALDDLDRHLTSLRAFLTRKEIWMIGQVVADADHWFDADGAVLAHGDFDATHIFHRDGDYMGMIDFGEIRGTDPFYDLGHAALHDGERFPEPLLPHLITGYGQVITLPDDAETRIHLWSLLIGIRTLARWIDRPRNAYHDHLVHAIQRALDALLRSGELTS